MTSYPVCLSEDRLIGILKKGISEVPSGWIGIGDDTALIKSLQGRLLFTIDVLNEGTHFIKSSFPPFYLGWKVIAVNVSDIAVKGGRAVAGVIYLNFPEAPSRTWVRDFLRGVSEACRRFRVSIVGGNTSRGELSIGCAMIGIEKHKFIRRYKAQDGDYVYLCGNVGFASRGLELIRKYGLRKALQKERKSVMAFLKPVPPLKSYSKILRRHYVSSAVDVSDSLYESLHYLVSENCDVIMESLPVKSNMNKHALYGGEDYAFLFTSPDEIHVKHGAVKIGRIVKGKGKVVVQTYTKTEEIELFKHF